MKNLGEITFDISQIQNKTLRPANSKQDIDFFPEDCRSEFNPDITKGNVTSDERLPILRLSTHKLPSQKSFLRESGSTTPRRKAFNSRSTLFVRNANDSRMEGYFKQARANASMFEVMQKSNATPLVHELNIILANMSPKQRLEKAARHLNDALYLRTVRHDIDITDSKLVKRAYLLQTNLTWQGFLYLLTLLFLIMTFLEPPNSSAENFFDENPGNLRAMLGLEIPILLLFITEFIMEICHKKNDPRTFKEKYLKNKVIISKLVLNLLFISDFIYFYSSLPEINFRFSRIFRPFCLALYSQQLRRTFFGIIKSLRQILEIIIFFVFIACIFAAIGVRLIGDLEGQESYDQFSTNFKDFGPAMNALYILFTKDNYPDVMIPAITNSPYYLFYFIPFVAINTLLFVPIPIAVIFDAFREYRSNLVISERIKEREALVACFLCLDVDKSGSISKDEFMALFLTTYGKNLDEERVDEVFEALDEKRQGKISLDTFFILAELMEDSKSLSKTVFVEVKWWNILRKKLNQIFKFDKIVNHIVYEIFMTLVVLFNTVILLYYAFEDDDAVLDTLNSIDDILVYIYISEIVFRIIGTGLTQYFSDKWNILDFSLTIISLATDIAVSFAKVARTAKAGRLFRFTRAQRAFKLVKVLRGFKLFKCCYAGFKSFNRIQRFFQNIMLCLPIVLKLTVILFMVSYVYAIIGMEIFDSRFAVRSGESPYFQFTYADFDDLGGALLILFQVIVQAGWAELLYDWAWRFDNLTKSSLYFNTFSSITNYVIISLLTGLIWEVFTYMEKQFEQQDKIDEQLDEIYYGNSLKRSIASKKTEKLRSREASLSELEFGNLNDSQMIPKRQVKSLTSLEVPSTSARAEVADINYTQFDFRNDIKPLPRLRLVESMGPGTPMKNMIPKGQPLLPSRFKVNVLTPSKSESQNGIAGDEARESNEEDRMLDQGPNDIDINFINKEDANSAFADTDRYAQSYLGEPISPEGRMAFPKSRSSQDQKRTDEEFIDPSPINRRGKAPSNPDANLKRLSGLTGFESKGFATSLQDISDRDLKDLKRRHSKLYAKKMITRHFPDFRGGDQMSVIPDSDQSVDNLDYLEDGNSQGEENKIDYQDLSKKIVNKRLQKVQEEGSFDFASIPQNMSIFAQRGANGKLLSLPARQDSRAARKFGRSDSLNASVKLTQTTFGPVINKIFINDMIDPQLEKAESKNLEKEFYMRKIVVCKHVSTEKNQMEYTDNLHSKEKFKYEKKLLKLDSDESSESEEEGVVATKSEDEFNDSESKTKQLEGLRKKMKAKISQTADRILRKALLQNQNQSKIQRYEDEHFYEMYGQWFEYLKNPKIERVKDVFEIENKILVRFMRLMKQDEIISRDFVEILHMIEESININLLRKGSMGKFLFKDVQGKWFFVFQDGQKFRIHYLNAGFWNYSDDIFTDKTKLYEGQDILFPGTNQKYKEPVDDFYSSLTKLSKKINKSGFEEFDKEESLWNLYILPFKASSIKNLRRDLLMSASTNHKLNITSIDSTMISEGIFFSVNYIMNAKSMTNSQMDKRFDTNQIIEMEKSSKEELYKQYQSFVRTPKIIKKGNNRRSSLVVEVSGKSSESPKARKGHKKKTVHEFLKGNTKDMDFSPLGKASRIEEFLPLQEYLDFLKDIRDTLNLHADHLLCKVSALYSELHSKNKN